MLERESLESYCGRRGLAFQTIKLNDTLVRSRNKSEHFERYYKHGNLHVAKLPDVVYIPSIRLFIAEDRYILDGLTLPHLAQAAINNPGILRKAANIIDFSPSSPALVIGGCHNYYHWLMNWSSKLFAASRYKMMDDVGTVVLSRANYGFHRETIDGTQIAIGRRVVNLDESVAVRFHDSVFPTMLPNPVHALDHIDYLRDTFLPAPAGFEGPKRIYISRDDSSTRRVLNESDILPVLERFGFSRILLAEHTVSQQAALFAGADYIVAPHGAGLVNLIHCRRKPEVLEIYSASSFSRVFRSLAILSDSKSYNYLRCEEVGDRSGNKKDILVAADDLLRFFVNTWGL